MFMCTPLFKGDDGNDGTNDRGGGLVRVITVPPNWNRAVEANADVPGQADLEHDVNVNVSFSFFRITIIVAGLGPITSHIASVSIHASMHAANPTRMEVFTPLGQGIVIVGTGTIGLVAAHTATRATLLRVCLR
jgi:hypothetical protein